MKFRFFKACWNTPIEEAKQQYHKLVLQYHPDRGGSGEEMKLINMEWDWLRKHNYNVHQAANGAVYTNEWEEAPDDLTQKFATIIGALVRLDGVVIEICGSFIWLSGDTLQWKDAIKALGFKWARKKKMWYMAPKNYRRRGGEWTMDQIRVRHGSHVVDRETEVPQILMLGA